MVTSPKKVRYKLDEWHYKGWGLFRSDNDQTCFHLPFIKAMKGVLAPKYSAIGAWKSHRYGIPRAAV